MQVSIFFKIFMRIDKFLKVSRLIKRRTVASEACQQNRVKVNGKVAKPSTKVKVDDIIEITFGNKEVKVKVKELLNITKKDQSSDMFEYI